MGGRINIQFNRWEVGRKIILRNGMNQHVNLDTFIPIQLTERLDYLTLQVTTGPNSARAISADRAHGRNSAQFGMTL